MELSHPPSLLLTSTDTLAGESARPSPTEARQALYERFESRIEVGDHLSRSSFPIRETRRHRDFAG